ncbi:MAG: YkgJ family cysteine cluster protein [Methanothrix sp.]|nr:YkgJ family cysteine cluster protein [Methanothrix sp.]
MQEMIAQLNEAFLAAKKINPTKLAAQIRELGFHCLQCGECCRGEDNSVVVFPQEIRQILIATGLPWLEVVGPPEEGEWDKDGCFHTLEWRLKKEGESCRFYQNGRCSVYRDRPMLCRTYPFYLDNCELMCSECRGLGGKITSGEADKMAEKLIMRYLFEIQEAIALLQRYRDFERGEAKKGDRCIVHDSEGEHRIVGGALLE